MSIRVLTVIAAVSLSACAGTAPPKDSFYRLEVTQPAQHFPAPPLPGVLEIDRLTSDGVVGERALTFARGEGGPLEHYNYDFWSEPPGIMLQDALAATLRRANAAERVVTPDLRVPSDWMLRGKVRRFEQVAGADKVAVEIQLGVVSARDGTLVLLNSYSAEPSVGGNRSIQAAVVAIDSAVSDILARFVADLGQARLGGLPR